MARIVQRTEDLIMEERESLAAQRKIFEEKMALEEEKRRAQEAKLEKA